MIVQVIKTYSEATVEQYLFEYLSCEDEQRAKIVQHFSKESATPRQKKALEIILLLPK